MMSNIKVVNKYKHTPTPNDIYVGRGSALGNPYTCKALHKTKAKYQANSREDSIGKYEIYLRNCISSKDAKVCAEMNRIYKAAVNGEVNLVCYCAPNPCHADVIKKIIDDKIL